MHMFVCMCVCRGIKKFLQKFILSIHIKDISALLKKIVYYKIFWYSKIHIDFF